MILKANQQRLEHVFPTPFISSEFSGVLFFFLIYSSIEGQLLYRIVLVSAKQRESAIDLYMSPPHLRGPFNKTQC